MGGQNSANHLWQFPNQPVGGKHLHGSSKAEPDNNKSHAHNTYGHGHLVTSN